MPENPHEAVQHEKTDEIDAALRAKYAPVLPTGPFAENYRIAGYTHGLVGSAPDCIVIAPRWDSGIKWPDPNNPSPEDVLWGGGVRFGTKWDGTFYRDLSRYSQSGSLFWCSYFKPGSAPGEKQGYWINFGKGWSHLANDDFSQLLTGASQRLAWEAGVAAPASGASGGAAGTAAATPGSWKLIIEATQYVTHAVIPVWVGVKAGGQDPVGEYTRITGCDLLPLLSIEAQ